MDLPPRNQMALSRRSNPGRERAGRRRTDPLPLGRCLRCSGDYEPVYPPDARPITVSSYEACARDKSAFKSLLFAFTKTCVSPG